MSNVMISLYVLCRIHTPPSTVSLVRVAKGADIVTTHAPCFTYLLPNVTRKLSGRKDDRAMRPMGYGCPENFWKSPTTRAATFSEIFNGLLSGRSHAYKI